MIGSPDTANAGLRQLEGASRTKLRGDARARAGPCVKHSSRSVRIARPQRGPDFRRKRHRTKLMLCTASGFGLICPQGVVLYKNMSARKQQQPIAASRELAVDLSAVIVGVAGDQPQVLALRPEAGAPDALPSGPLESRHHTLEAGLR